MILRHPASELAAPAETRTPTSTETMDGFKQSAYGSRATEAQTDLDCNNRELMEEKEGDPEVGPAIPSSPIVLQRGHPSRLPLRLAVARCAHSRSVLTGPGRVANAVLRGGNGRLCIGSRHSVVASGTLK